MKKFLKGFLIAIASLLAIATIIISIALWLVFAPEKLTPIINKQIDKHISCQADIGKVEATFFSTFPHFGIQVNGLTLINPVAGSPNDTLASAEKLIGSIDLSAWWTDKEIKINKIAIEDGNINIFIDSLGHTNYNILNESSASAEDEETESLNLIGIENLELRNVSISYTDHSMKLTADIMNVDGQANGFVKGDNAGGKMDINRSYVSLEYDGEKCLDNALFQIELPANIGLSEQLIKLKDALVSVNDLKLALSGTAHMENDGSIFADIVYSLDSWDVKKLLMLLPPSFEKNMQGLDASGLLSSKGIIKGIYNDSIMPLLDIQLSLENGAFSYSDIPLSIKQINGDISFYSDLTTDSLSFVRINRVNLKTPQSFIEGSGTIDCLFSDIHCNLKGATRLSLSELSSLIPKEYNTAMKGIAKGSFSTDFSMSQIENLGLEKMKLSGSFDLSGIKIAYDSLVVEAGIAKADFSLPNHKATSKGTRFAFFDVVADRFKANMLDGFNADMRGMKITMETSDVRDSSVIPTMSLVFDMDSAAAGMDTMNIALAKPKGKVFLAPRAGRHGEPAISLIYNGENLRTNIGSSSAFIKKLDLSVEVANDSTAKNIAEQWIGKGHIDMEESIIAMPDLMCPLEIPSIKMDFDQENLNIHESKLKIGNSDFQLAGKLMNVQSYYRGDSLLKGDLSFVSENTDIIQLMNLTNAEQGSASANAYPENSGDVASFAGPYMVPQKVELQLNTNIRHATFGIDTIKNIDGLLRVQDGIMALEEITCETDAAKMQLTALYRTPRKNHLFLGLDYHLLDVEIEELLKMIPDIDTLMPMLRSFRGRGEFHIAVETYLDSLYNIKKSTLRGASSIKGQDLVLMDGETFSEIAKKLMFSKKTENIVDSLSAEFTIFREEIDIYPFLIVMDKYKAVIAGRHNFDLSFDYHISVVDCPLPVKLGIDVKGTMDNFSYDLVKCRYAEFYRPSSRKAVENKQLELRKMIREALTQRVRD